MMQVWFLFKIIETIFGAVCVAYHALGFSGKEPLPHILIFCGTFFGFCVMSLTGAIALGVGAAPPALTEFIINFLAAVLYFIASIVSMHYAEIDFHLMYLSDFEEPRHPYFALCRSQSISALAAGSLHLLHAVLAFDVMCTPKNQSDNSDQSSSDSDSEVTTLERRPIRMYFLSKVIETKLRRYEWFDHLCRRRSPSISIFSFRARRRDSKRYSTSSIPASKSFVTKEKPKDIKEKTPKKRGKKTAAAAAAAATATATAPNTLNDNSSDEEESVTDVQYSDIYNPKRPYGMGNFTFKDEKSHKTSPAEPASTSSYSEGNEHSRKLTERPSTRFALPQTAQPSEASLPIPINVSTDTSQRPPSILRKEVSAESGSSKQDKLLQLPATQSENQSEQIQPEREEIGVQMPSFATLPPPTPAPSIRTLPFENLTAPMHASSSTLFPKSTEETEKTDRTDSNRTSVSALTKLYENKLGTEASTPAPMPAPHTDTPPPTPSTSTNPFEVNDDVTETPPLKKSSLESATSLENLANEVSVVTSVESLKPPDNTPNDLSNSLIPNILDEDTPTPRPSLSKSSLAENNEFLKPKSSLLKSRSHFQLTPLKENPSNATTVPSIAEPAESDEHLIKPTTSLTQPINADIKKLDDSRADSDLSLIKEPLSKVSVGTSVPSLSYTDDIMSIQTLEDVEDVRIVSTGTSIPSLPFSDEDSAPSFINERSEYFTPTASTGSIFERFRDDNSEDGDEYEEDTTPKPSKSKIKKQTDSPPPPPSSS